ncbi:T9SS type B sorting domain-containing protein [Echinicola rosea]|nr:gliding motility-associated C-terminal domain-containing protein [Echinicola rosea]
MSIKRGTVVSSNFDLNNTETGKLLNDGDLYLYAHFNNDGEVTFSQGDEGNTRFVGKNGVQDISGSQISNLNNVLFENPNHQNAFHLSGDISISGVSRFVDGVVLSDGNGGLVLFERGSTYEGASDASHVDGYVEKRGDEDFDYPVGDGGFFRFAGISAPSDSDVEFHTKYFFEDPDGSYPREQKEEGLELIDDAEYWELFLENGNDNDDVRLTLSWRDVTTPAFILGVTSDIVVAKWDEGESLWTNLGGDVDGNSQTVTTPDPLEDDGIFTLAVMSANMTNMSISKTSFEASVYEGDVFEYEIRVQNNGGVDASNVVIVDNLPNGVEYESMEVESAFGLLEWDMEAMGQVLTWSVPLFRAGDEMIIKLRVTAGNAGPITNYAEVGSSEEDGDPSDNAATDENNINAFFIPNVITPNDDGDNDLFEIRGLNRFTSNRIVILNRWNDEVLDVENYQNDWNASGLIAGTYFYILEVTEPSGEEKEFKGWIQVIKE